MSVKKIAVAIVGFTLAAGILLLYLHHTPEEISFYQQNDTIYIHQSDRTRLSHEVLLKQDPGFQNTETEDCDPYSQIAACKGFAIYAHQGESVGIICLLNGHAQYFDWQYQTPRQITPQVTILDDNFYACILGLV